MDRDRLIAELRALGEPTRLELVLLLCRGERGGSDLLKELGVSQPSLSRHLGVLRQAAIIQERRDGRRAYYRLSDSDLVAWVVSRAGGEVGPQIVHSEPKNMSKIESINAIDGDEEDEEPRSGSIEEWLL